MKVVLADAFSLEDFGYDVESRIFEANGVEFRLENCRTDEEVVTRCFDADILLSIYTKVNDVIMDALPRCKGLIRYGVGYDVLDVAAATERGILVCNLPDYCQIEVAMHTMAMLLATSRQLVHFSDQVKAGKWSADPGREMRRPSSQVLGLAGFGSIARLVATYAKPLGYQMIAYDPMLPENVFPDFDVRPVALEELMKQADVISCHTPLTEKTLHMFDKKAFASMKDGVTLINTSRGALICEADLIEALRSGKVGAAALDVMESEPILTANHPFATMNNVLLSPHIAYKSVEASYDQHRRVAETAMQILRGEVPSNTVNRGSLSPGAIRPR